MKKLFLIALLLFVFGKPSIMLSQNVRMDTADYPYWVSMMQDPSQNFFKTQRAFYTYWKDRPITKGCGWKVFKRWEYMCKAVSIPMVHFPPLMPR